MGSITHRLQSALCRWATPVADRPFVSSGVEEELDLPSLHVKNGLGDELALPLDAHAVASLRSVAGSPDRDPSVAAVPGETASVVSSSGGDWATTLDELVAGPVAASLDMSPAAKMVAHLEALLVCAAGTGAVVPDGLPTVDGVFGSLLLTLPVVGGHRGGTLTVRYHGTELRIAGDVAGGDSPLWWSAYYADAAATLEQPSVGTRVILVYSLGYLGGGELAPPPSPWAAVRRAVIA